MTGTHRPSDPRWRVTLTQMVRGDPYWWVVVVLIASLTGIYVVYAEPGVPPWDPSSMVILGKSLVENHSLQYYDPNNRAVGPYFNPHGFDIRAPQDPQPYSTFPPGFSLFVAAAYILGQERLLFLMPPLFGLVGLVASAYLGHVLGGRWASIFAVLLIGTSHVIATFSTSLWSDGPSLSLLLTALALYVAANRSNKKWLLLVTGSLLGAFVLFKFVNVTFAALILGHQVLFKRGREGLISATLLAVGTMAGMLGLLLYQTGAYGSPLANAYQPWGQSRYPFPLFSMRYLFVKSPAPWSDIAGQAIVEGLLRDMHVWIIPFAVGVVVRRRDPWAALLGLIAGINILVYAISVFTPRQFINMRYMLPALAMAYLLAAGCMAKLVSRLRRPAWRVSLAAIMVLLCFGHLSTVALPEFASRNANTLANLQAVSITAGTLPAGSVVMAYTLADTFILYGNLSVLNYRRIAAPDVQARNQLAIQAVNALLCTQKPVYLVQDDQTLFNTIYPDLARRFALQRLSAPLTLYKITETVDPCQS
jgi:hypothetical protein